MPLGVRLLLAALVCVLAGVIAGLPGAGRAPVVDLSASPKKASSNSGDSRRPDSSTKPGQTSEGTEGPKAEPMPDGFTPRPRIAKVRHWRLVRGVTYRQWDQTDRRGKIRAHLLRVNLRAPGVSIDYASMPHVPERNTLGRLLARNRAIAGVNGGFFDIYDTGAPLGIGRDRQRGMLHGSKYTWNNAFSISRSGVPNISRMQLTARVDQFPQMQISNVNSPRVREGHIGIYTRKWGRTMGYRITDGQTRGVRMVVLQDGRVVANRARLNYGKVIDGPVLVGRGPGAEALEQMRVGSLASVHWGLPGPPAMAVSGEKILLKRGQMRVQNDRELHPRTAIGIDRDRHQVLMLCIDGRTRHSRGYTLVELARMMRHLGAEDALNLDGGGSSTMVGEGRGGDRQVLNAPSDGHQRSIADGIAVLKRRR